LRLLQHPGPPWALTTSGRLPAGAAGLKANLIRVLKATVKGPGATPGARLINGLHDQGPPTSAGNHPDFHPGTGASRRAAPPLIRDGRLSAMLTSLSAGRAAP